LKLNELSRIDYLLHSGHNPRKVSSIDSSLNFENFVANLTISLGNSISISTNLPQFVQIAWSCREVSASNRLAPLPKLISPIKLVFFK
jgi:hypothetical protein